MCDTCGCKPLARSRVYQFISPAFSYPSTAALELIQSRLPGTESWLLLLEDQTSLEAWRLLGPVVAQHSPERLETEYVQTFGHTISKECPPYEAEYGQAHIFQKSHALADVAGFYRAFGLETMDSFKDRLDHVSIELEFMHFLCLKEAYGLTKGHPEEQVALCREAQSKFLGEHLGLWAFEFAHKVEGKAADTLYAPMAGLLTAFLAFEMKTFGLEPGNVHGPDIAMLSEEDTFDCGTCTLVTSPANEVESHEYK